MLCSPSKGTKVFVSLDTSHTTLLKSQYLFGWTARRAHIVFLFSKKWHFETTKNSVHVRNKLASRLGCSLVIFKEIIFWLFLFQSYGVVKYAPFHAFSGQFTPFRELPRSLNIKRTNRPTNPPQYISNPNKAPCSRFIVTWKVWEKNGTRLRFFFWGLNYCWSTSCNNQYER